MAHLILTLLRSRMIFVTRRVRMLLLTSKSFSVVLRPVEIRLPGPLPPVENEPIPGSG
jgi:hypothetical protein